MSPSIARTAMTCRWVKRAVLATLVLCSSQTDLQAQQKGVPPLPPAKVVVAGVASGTVSPQSSFVGTVYYQQVSGLSPEVGGVVEEARFEEGERVAKGEVLVRLNSDLLRKTIQSANATYHQALSDLEKTKTDFSRVESLHREGLVSEQEYDELRFRLKGEEFKAESLRAEVERLEAELQRKVIRAPFDAVVIGKKVNIGEWLSPGSPVATLAVSDVVDIVVNVPEEVLGFIKPGQSVSVEAGGKSVKGKVFSIVPRGDVATRTFPVKIRVQNNSSLIEGMEAKVNLPTGKSEKSLIVPRDSVITLFGNTVVFAVVDSKASMVPVQVTGYDGMKAWVDSKALQEGMKVVVKGNERLRDGQPVEVLKK